MKKISHIILCVFILISSQAMAKSVVWDIETTFDNQIFPSFAWSTAHLSNELVVNEVGNFYGDGNAQVMVLFNNLKKGMKVKIITSCPQIMEESIMEFEMGESRETFFAGLQFLYDFDKLALWKQPKPAAMKVAVYIDDKPLGVKQKNIIVRSIYDCLFMAANRFNTVLDLNHNYASYVNENDPIISETIIPAILEQGVVNRIIGYQGTDEDVIRQVYALWHYFNKEKFTYSALKSYFKTPESGVPITQAQYVRTFADIYRTRSANCVDGTILFASILLKMGIYPYLILTPNHCYLAFEGVSEDNNMYFLETTLLGRDLSQADSLTQELVYSMPLSKDEEALRLNDETATTFNNFIWAILVAKEAYLNDMAKYKAENEGYAKYVPTDSLGTVMHDLNYQKISVMKYRNEGLLPIN